MAEGAKDESQPEGEEEEEGEDAEEAGKEDTRSASDKALDALEAEKKKMTPLEQLETSLLWKVEGNDFFKKGELFKAADCYYHSIVFARDLTKNPQYYPELKHTQQERSKAQELCESVFTNLALVQLKYGSSLDADSVERPKVLQEGAKSASEALKLNAKNVKALFRRAAINAVLAKDCESNSEAQALCAESKADLVKVVEAEPQNKEARAELKAVQEHLKQLKREEREGEKREFSFASTLSGLGFKEKDLLGDGSIRKQQISAGDGGKWLNEDWMDWKGATKCVVHLAVRQASQSGPAAPVSFILGDPDMHEGVNVAVRSMTKGEVANFTFASRRLSGDSGLTKLLPKVEEDPCVWQIEFQKFVTWEDLDRDGERLRKIQEEGYGAAVAEDLSEVFVHWRVFGADSKLVHSTRYTVSMGSGQDMKQVENEDKVAPSYIMGETTWEPVAMICRSLRQGGVAELRLRSVPDLPKDPDGDDVSAKLSMMLNRGSTERLSHCTIRAELEKVVPALTGPGDPRWQGAGTLVEERFRGEQLLEQGYEAAALARLRRVVAWSEQLPDQASTLQDVAAAKASIGWSLASRAAPILDSGSVSSAVLKSARKDLAEAEELCEWLEQNASQNAGTKLLRAKILVANDDDFAGAHKQLLEAQKQAPEDKRVQEELRKVKVELRKEEEMQSRAKVAEIRDGLKRARTEGSEVMPLLRQLSSTSCSWETVMETRIGVELKSCQECGAEAKKLCDEILAKFKDQSKEQRPLWEG
ncbi:unnamed protein product [Symbiodinium natans]|uniref:Peptidylprolyl isomerase n=1 Tax=Symbiodinium natans TaxID=878477 RepID=A0A812NBH6_9DINO|nr:unnamed protein product [Symbiodinium natans]